MIPQPIKYMFKIIQSIMRHVYGKNTVSYGIYAAVLQFIGYIKKLNLLFIIYILFNKSILNYV